MAKTQIKNYVFKPGLGVLDNRYPNAHGLITANKTFIQKEMSAYIAAKVTAAAQYTPTAATYNPATGVLELTIGTHNFNVGDAIIIADGGLTFTNASAGAVPFFDKALIITAVSANTSVTVNAGISTDLTAHSWVSSVTNATRDVFYNYVNDSVAKCERDTGYVIDAYLKDLQYGGNEYLKNVIKYYWDQNVAQVDGDRGAELAAHNFIGRLITDYILPQSAYSALNSEITQSGGTATETTAQFTPTDATYTPTTGAMTLSIGTHSLAVGNEVFIAPAGITFTCALDGNATLHPYPRGSGVPNDTGKDPFYYAPIEITAVTATTITVNIGISSDTSAHTFSSATANAVTAGPAAKIKTLVYNTVDVIGNGLAAMPTLVPTGVGSVKIQGNYNLEDFLLITNSSKNEIIYNFSGAATGGYVTQEKASDTDFVKFLQATDTVATLFLNYNTATHSSTDEIQIFVENTENGKSIVYTRPYDFGTDSIERQRIAAPLSMLDADFEYGLQPTKWAAIGTLRGYPSIYEIPGTDTAVASVTTDASSVNTWLLNLTADGTTNYTVIGNDRTGSISGPDPIITMVEGDTLQMINNSGSGHPLYIKTVAGTGTGNQVTTNITGQGAISGAAVEWTPQTGDAGIYYYQCSNHAAMSGTIIVQTNTAGAGSGQSLITVTTVSPHGFAAGTPFTIKALENSINGASRAEGSFVITDVPSTTSFRYYAKAQVGDTNGDVLSTTYTQLRQGGFYTGANIGSPVFTVATNGSGGTIAVELTTPIGSTNLPYDGPAATVGAPLSGAGIGAGTQVTSIIDNSDGGGEYLTPVVVGDYSAGVSTITVEDATGIVTELAASNGTGTATFIENINGTDLQFTTPFASAIIGNKTTYTAVSGTNGTSSGSGAEFTISSTAGTYAIDSITNPGTGYAEGDRLLVDGATLSGASGTNDLVIIVASISGSGIATTTLEGTGYDGSSTISSLTPTADGGSGTDASFDITYLNNVYTNNTLNAAGTGYSVNDVIRINGATLNGDESNSITYTITGVGGGGAITTFTVAPGATAPDANVFYGGVATTSNTIAGVDAIVNVQKTGTVYSLVGTGSFGGTGYVAGETFTIAGTELGGATPTNDVTITIDTVDGGTGAITASSITSVTTGVNGDSTTILPQNVLGSGADFEIVMTPSSTYVVNINSGGANYGPNQTFTILGTSLFGATPANDLTITIDTVTTGAVATISVAGTSTAGDATTLGVAPPNQPQAGSSATFNILRNAGGYTASIASGGSDYAVGNKIIVPGTSLGGSTPQHDLTIEIDTVNSGLITGVSTSAESIGYPGDPFTLICTVQLSEPTTAEIALGAEIPFTALATLELEFTSAHGLVPGSTFIVNVTSDEGINNHSIASGPFIASDIPSITKLRYQARSAGFIDVSSDAISGQVYPRPDSFFVHRPFDGGVQLGTGGPQHGAQAIRQSKKYIRYQSGKGIMYTTGALFAPSYDLRSVTSSGVEVGDLITVVTDDNDHGVQKGGIIRLLGVETPGYNSGDETAVPPKFDYEVVNVVDERTFQIRAQRRLGATEAVLGFSAAMTVVSWHGATVRSGIFDDQNGIFWEFDGTQLSVVQRTGTKQLAGTIAVTVDNNLVTGTNTRFEDQLKAGDRIIIKGMTHVVSHVLSQTSCTVTPDWRGTVDVLASKANLISDKKVKQSNFNLDRLDGTGPSGYNLDIGKMQMIGIQYSWYGAGFIDFMLRGADGNFTFAHRMRNSNVNTEAFMRSGNLPVRYEVSNEGPSGKLKTAMDSSQTTVVLEDSSFFPPAGTIYIDNEIMQFSGNNKNTNTLTGVTRGATFRNFQAGAQRSYTAGAAEAHTARTGVILISNTITPLISHWGSAFLTDGGFDEDRGYIFSYAATGVPISTTKNTAFMIRLAPSVSNALVGDLGERELLNRAQLLLQGLEITSDTSTGGIVVQGVLNPQNYPLDPGSVTWSGLSGVAQGGQPSFAQIAPGGGTSWATGAGTTATAAISSSIDTGAFSPLEFGAAENSSPIDLTNTVYNAAGPVYSGVEIYESDSGGAYTVAGETFLVTSVNVGGSSTDIAFRSTLGRTRKRQNFSTNPPSVFFRQPSYTGLTNKLIFAKSVWEAAGATEGTPVATSDTNWPAGTAVSSVALKQLGATQFYEVTFNQSSTSALSVGNNVTFDFSEPPFAQPGETVFSFIANPGERSTLDLSQLKELTNTPLGGRGTYPNGPDVLAINVYKISGTDVAANIILKWGEAQA
jgi:plastocyanin